VGLKLKRTHLLLTCADDTDTSKEVGLEINIEKTKYMLLSSHQKASQNQDLKIANKSFENVLQFRYL
jgi:hypothetical protein